MGGWNFIDRTDMRWGKLVAKKYLGHKKWLCQCDCGNTTIVNSDHLPLKDSKRATTSCGCNLLSRKMPNHNFFENIDSEEKAYILGFLAADGTIEDNFEKSSFTVKIVVNIIDKELLEKIKEAYGTLADIKEYETTTKLPQGTTCTSKFASLTIHGKKLIEDLNDIGITSNKSLTLKINYNKIPDELKKHFWRGLVDGDGTFGIYGKKQLLEFNITTSLSMCQVTKEEILKIFPEMSIKFYQVIGANEKTKRFVITKQKDIMTFLSYIYEDNKITLERKYKKYLNIKNSFNNKL